MYLQRLEIENIRSIKKLTWEVAESNCAGWHVFLGENGSGKTTVIRSACVTSSDRNTLYALRVNWFDWKKNQGETSSIRSNIILSHFDKVEADQNIFKLFEQIDVRFNVSEFEIASELQITNGIVPSIASSNNKGINQLHLQGATIKAGMFCCAYGPFRRFLGGDRSIESEINSGLNLDRFLTAFGEEYVLGEALSWLVSLNHKELEEKSRNEVGPARALLANIRAFVNQSEFLPHQAKIDTISSAGVTFVDGNGATVPVEELSDGYRSVLSLTFDIIRQLARTFKVEEIFDKEDPTKIVIPGVVLIDEVDAHLHPTWQKKIGFWFRRAFPKMQFIVTTHSPLVCQAAALGGSVYKLAAPGSDDEGQMLEGSDLNRVLYGDILDAYDTPAFGLPDTRSDLGGGFVHELALLNRKERHEKLNPVEKARQAELRSLFPTLANE